MSEPVDTQSIKAELMERQPTQGEQVVDLIQRLKPQLVRSLQDQGAAEMLTRHYYTAVRGNPKLLEATADSQAGALLLSAQLRLEPGPLGHVYLVPFKGEVVWILGYTGIMELARRSERIAALRSRVIWDNDDYTYHEDERGEHFRLSAGDETDRTERLRVLVTWKERAGGAWVNRAVECPRSRVERAKKASPAFKVKQGPWMTDEDAMWAKTGVRYVRAWLPLSPDFARGVEADNRAIVGIETHDDVAYPVLDVKASGAVDEAGESGDTDA